jgi:copper chaperone CopZ
LRHCSGTLPRNCRNFGAALVNTPYGYMVWLSKDEEGVMTESTYTVEGMSCDHCVAAVTGELRGLPGVTSVDVDLASGRVRVVSASPLDPSAVRAAIDEAGYEVVT